MMRPATDKLDYRYIFQAIPNNLIFGLIGASNVLSLGGYSAFIPISLLLQVATATYFYEEADREPSRFNQYRYIACKFGFMTPCFLACLLLISQPLAASITFQLCKGFIIQASANYYRKEINWVDNLVYFIQNISNAVVFMAFAQAAMFVELACLLFLINMAFANYRYREEPVIKNCFNANIGTTTLLFIGLVSLNLSPVFAAALYSLFLLAFVGMAERASECVTDESIQYQAKV